MNVPRECRKCGAIFPVSVTDRDGASDLAANCTVCGSPLAALTVGDLGKPEPKRHVFLGMLTGLPTELWAVVVLVLAAAGVTLK